MPEPENAFQAEEKAKANERAARGELSDHESNFLLDAANINTATYLAAFGAKLHNRFRFLVEGNLINAPLQRCRTLTPPKSRSGRG
jgi:hypothetical protein